MNSYRHRLHVDYPYAPDVDAYGDPAVCSECGRDLVAFGALCAVCADLLDGVPPEPDERMRSEP